MFELLIISFCSMQLSMSINACNDYLHKCVEKDLWIAYEESNYTEIPTQQSKILSLQFCIDNWEDRDER